MTGPPAFLERLRHHEMLGNFPCQGQGPRKWNWFVLFIFAHYALGDFLVWSFTDSGKVILSPSCNLYYFITPTAIMTVHTYSVIGNVSKALLVSFYLIFTTL